MKTPSTNSKIPQGINKILWLAMTVVVTLIGLYIYKFGSFSLSDDREVWGQFGDYIGGTANPLFGFLTFIALIITISIQNKQLQVSTKELELSRKELEMTRLELARSATAQESSEKALRAQAEISSRTTKLNTISFLLEKYTNELKKYKDQHYPIDTPQFKEKMKLMSRCRYLEDKLEEVFNELKLGENIDHE